MATFHRRQFLVSLGAAAAVAGHRGLALASDATPGSDATPAMDHDHDHGHDHDHAEGDDVFLIVADSETAKLTIYNTHDNSVVGHIDDVVINGHAGFLPLANGTVLTVDSKKERLIQIGMHDGHVEIMGEASVPGHVAHIAVESDHAHHCAVGTSADDEHQLHLVNLEDWSVTSLQLADAAEVGLMMTHDHFFHRNSELNQVESYAISSLLEEDVTILSSVPVGTRGHGEAVNEETGELFVATDDGVDVLYVEEGELTHAKTLPWPDGGGRGFFGRLINNGKHFYTYASDRSAPETEWNTWKSRSIVYDVATDEAIVEELPDGYLMRYALGEKLAVYVVIGGEGDVAVSIDLNPESDTFGRIVSTIPLEPMSGAAKPGDAFYEVGAYRAATILPDASKGYVTQGGDSQVIVIDPQSGTVLESIQHESALMGGGTLAVFGSGVPFTDTIGR